MTPGGLQTMLEEKGVAGAEAQAMLGAYAELRAMAAEIERERLFALIREMVRWENTANGDVWRRASREIWQSWRRQCAAVRAAEDAG